MLPFNTGNISSHDDKRVLFRWNSCIWNSFRLHMRIPQEGPSPKHLALVREEGCLGSVLQSCSDRNKASYCCCSAVYVYGILPDFSEMTRMDQFYGQWTIECQKKCNAGKYCQQLMKMVLHLLPMLVEASAQLWLKTCFAFCKCLGKDWILGTLIFDQHNNIGY